MKKILNYLLVLLVVFTIPITIVDAKTIGDLEKELEAAQKKLNDTNTQKAINSQNLKETQNKISEIQSSIKKTEESIDQKTKESEQLEKDIQKKNEQTKDLMRYYQKSSSGSALIEYIMGAESITDLVYRLSITEQI